MSCPSPLQIRFRLEKKFNTVPESNCQFLKHLVELTRICKLLLKCINFFLGTLQPVLDLDKGNLMKQQFISFLIVFVIGSVFSSNLFAAGDVQRGKEKLSLTAGKPASVFQLAPTLPPSHRTAHSSNTFQQN